ncbi:MAG: hypothetical protein ACFFC7_29330 [Candidatus Hermodarchaeota archaeon]
MDHYRGEDGKLLWLQEQHTHNLSLGRGSIRGIGSKEKVKNDGVRVE